MSQGNGIRNPVFLRPRRFGKSLLCSILRYYYDRNYTAQFDELFGHTWIGQHIGQQNQYLVLYLNFSTIATGPTFDDIDQSFRRQCNNTLNNMRRQYAPWLDEMPVLDLAAPVADNLSLIFDYLWQTEAARLFVIIDEYDNFANQLVTGHKDQLYRQLIAEDSFFKSFFKTLKEGRETGAIANVFITGVLPILIDELASGFNIASIIILDQEFEAMLGFTQSEVDRLLDEVYRDYGLDPTTRQEVDTIIRNHYNGYHFVSSEGEALYNSTILMYFLQHLTRFGEMPEFLTDLNLRTDLSWVRRLTSANAGDTEAFVTQLTTENRIGYDKNFLTTKFNTSQFFQPGFYPISFFYLGIMNSSSVFYRFYRLTFWASHH